jgi:hypothetical protein
MSKAGLLFNPCFSIVGIPVGEFRCVIFDATWPADDSVEPTPAVEYQGAIHPNSTT